MHERPHAAGLLHFHMLCMLLPTPTLGLYITAALPVKLAACAVMVIHHSDVIKALCRVL